MSQVRIFAFFALLFAAAGPTFSQDYELVWSDEFDGFFLDSSKWEVQTGNGCPNLCGWGNNELQYYRAQNLDVSDGMLTITAREESFGGADYTSSRIRTLFRGDWTHGRFEMRAKLPIGQGIWPAFWMLPSDSEYGVWAASGEIDIMEYIGQDPDRVLGTLHYGGTFPDNTYSGDDFILDSGTFHDDFHEFALEWDECSIRWYVDGIHYQTQTNWFSSNASYPAPFDQRFHLLLNLAVGGNLPGPPDETTQFPQEYVVDYVRVYQRAPNLEECRVEYDGMEHGNPFGRGSYFIFGGVGGGSINATSNVPPVEGCDNALDVGFGSGGNPGFYGGFGRTNRRELTDMTHFTMWINPAAGQEYTLEINLQDDDDGDDSIPQTPDGGDDEFQYNFRVGPIGPDAIAGGGWQRVSIPLADFFDDSSFHFGGNGILDPTPTSEGGNGRLINVVFAITTDNGDDVNFVTDRWAFTRRTSSVGGRVWEDADGDGTLDGNEIGLSGVEVELYDEFLGTLAATETTASDGSYSFDELIGGVFEVRVNPATLPGMHDATYDPDGLGTPDMFEAELDCNSVLADENFGYQPTASDAPAGQPSLRLGNAPNPFAEQTEIRFELAERDDVKIRIYDVTGRCLITLAEGERVPGPHSVTWNGNDAEGRRLPGGLYFYSLESSAGTTVRSLEVVR